MEAKKVCNSSRNIDRLWSRYEALRVFLPKYLFWTQFDEWESLFTSLYGLVFVIILEYFVDKFHSLSQNIHKILQDFFLSKTFNVYMSNMTIDIYLYE